MEVLFKTQHGSKLYGLANADSDDDWFTVVSKKGVTNAHTRKRYAKQSIVDGVDSTVVDFSTWMAGCLKGVPQYLEAMFATNPQYDAIEDFRNSFRVTSMTWDTYYRTIKSFALQEGYKPKRHALRLGLNLQDIGRYGRFNPTLSEQDAAYISDMANKSHEDVYGLALALAYDV